MRIKELYLDGFGHFRQRSIGPVSGKVIVFYGPNEAGKSTLLAFIRAILFGFPRTFNSHYPPPPGDRHGGRITVLDSTGSDYTIERYAGVRGGLNITAANGQASNPEVLLQRLTGNASPDLFRNVFAFSLDELQAAASLNDSSGAIYSAGQGAPGLPALMKSLKEGKERIYLTRGNNQEIPRLLNALRDVDEQLRYIEGNAGRYGALTARKAAIDLELQDADAELDRISAQRAEIRNLLNGWEDWVALSGCETQLRDMPRYIDFPENPVARLDSLIERAKEAREYRDEAAGQLRRAEEAATTDIPGETLLADEGGIEAIRRARSSFDNSVGDLPERQGELRGLEADFARKMAELGHPWGEAELQAFDTSLVVRNQVDVWKARLGEAGERHQRAQSQLAQERQTVQDRQRETQEAQDKLPPEPSLNAAALTERQNALRSARGRLSEYEQRRQHYDTLVGQLNALAAARETPVKVSRRNGIVPVAALAVAGAVLAVGGIALGGGALLLGIICGLILMVAAVMLWFMGRPSPPAEASPMSSALGQQTAVAKDAMESALRSLMESGAALGLAGQPDGADLDEVEARLESARNALEARNVAKERLEDAARREKIQEQRLEGAAADYGASQAALQEAQREWRQWLGERRLDETLTPEAMTIFIAHVEGARSSLSEARRMRDRVAAIEHDIQDFRERVEPLAAGHGMALEPEDRGQLASVADELIRELEAVRSVIGDRERAERQADGFRQQLERRERRLQSAERELVALLAEGGAEDAERFRRRASQHEERKELERRRDEHRRSLEQLSGPGERFDAFCAALAMAEPDRLTQESGRVSDLYAEVDSRRNSLREERGGIDVELHQLSVEEESSALRGRRSTLKEQLREQAREWSRLTIAEALLGQTRDKFERERQPGVIRHAQQFFSDITAGRYGRVYAPIGERTITVTDTAGASKQPEKLSRGTREQLYLALRFGLIREFGEHAECLPVVVDEALVNFDLERARLAAEAFAQLAETNQTLVFTCHPYIAEMFAEAANAQVVDIG